MAAAQWGRDDKVVSPVFGSGVVAEVRPSDGVSVIRMDWGATAYVPEAEAARSQAGFKKVPELFEMSDGDKLAMASKYKDKGNGLFKLGDFRDAISQYELARVYVRHLAEPPSTSKEMVLPLLSNLALCHLRLDQPGEAIVICDEGLKVEANAKLLYLRGQARRKVLDVENAASDLVKAVKLAPNNKQIRLELEEVKQAMKEAERKQREMFQGRLHQASSAADGSNTFSGSQDKSGAPPPSKSNEPPWSIGDWWVDPRVLVGVALVGAVLGYLVVHR